MDDERGKLFAERAERERETTFYIKESIAKMERKETIPGGPGQEMVKRRGYEGSESKFDCSSDFFRSGTFFNFQKTPEITEELVSKGICKRS